MNNQNLDKPLVEDLQSKNIDIDLACSVLDRLQKGDYSNTSVTVGEIPKPDDPAIIDCTGPLSYSCSRNKLAKVFAHLEIGIDAEQFGLIDGPDIGFDNRGLNRLGNSLAPYLSYGILNGGSATSYADEKKNRGFHSEIYDYYSKFFREIIDKDKGRPKGLTPAFVQHDGSPGPEFLELKMRGLLYGARNSGHAAGLDPFLPMYQMTSVSNDAEIAQAYEEYRESAFIRPLLGNTSQDVTSVMTAVQPLIAAYTKQENDWSLFANAHGFANSSLPLPGGHGQCFLSLKGVFQNLRKKGKRWVLLGNVDNLGNLPKPEYLALLALTGAPAAFEFAYRTPVDIKGGILVRDDRGRLTCADIGPAISMDDVEEAEKSGKRILFNCATGWFSLDYLESQIDRIIQDLPLRVSRQDKDAGEYWQAEQIAWEVISLIDNPLILGVDKYERFLAAKLFSECLLTSGIGLEASDFPAPKDIRETARSLNRGLSRLLTSSYGLVAEAGVWRPI